ncbi:hypothetical protein WSS_A43134 [Rhodococcus opacus M213]|uniref:Uncharacterized protein n=1 Tax=Rhodococcus opacus M213 TaxID=1129896 RepID=K8XGV1_RHOOP|nr:hypothetical protein [Rhodococcus opacus]EKT76365.1 hypothetical protein WSS_A43134 [Rhodococcus opacus M213]
MTDFREYVGQASTSYRDWVGTAAAENDAVGPDLYRVVGLDSGSWIIVGFDIYGGGGDGEDVFVYAVNTEGDATSLDAAAESDGALPVTSFMLHDVAAQQVIDTMQQYHMHLRVSAIGDRPVHVIE